jgi:tetratricopeptide (TPR) repeat protein
MGAMPALYYASPLALAAISWWVWKKARHGKAVAFGFLFFLVNIVFVLQFKAAGKAFMSDRFTYIPYLGLFYVLARTYSDIELGRIKTRFKSVLPYLAAGFVAMCAVLAIMQNATWRSSLALWENATAKQPEDALSWSNLGLAYDALEEYEKAADAYGRAVRLNDGYFDATFNLAVALNKLKRYDDAARMFGRAIELKPDFAEAWYGRAAAWFNKGDFLKAAADMERYAQMNPKEPADKVQSALGTAYAKTGRHNRAIAAFDLALKLKPAPEYYYGKGNSLATIGRLQEAIACYDAALALAPDYAEAVHNKGNAYASMGKLNEALAEFDKAVGMKPGAANFRFNRGVTRRSAGDSAGACADWRQAAADGYGQAQVLIRQLCK